MRAARASLAALGTVAASRLRPSARFARLVEPGRVRPHTLPLTRALGVSVEALIDGKATPARRGPAPQIQQKIERLTRLPKAKQKLVLEMLDGVLQQAAR